MNMKFIENDWELNYPNVNSENEPFIIGTDTFEGFVLHSICHVLQQDDLDECEAHAILIKNAPKLAKTLIQLVNRIDETWENICNGDMKGAKTALLFEAKEILNQLK